MIVSFVVIIVALLMLTKIETEVVTLVTLAFLSFFFLYLLRLLNIINRPFKVGQERSDDDVSLFLLYEFVVHARSAGRDLHLRAGRPDRRADRGGRDGIGRRRRDGSARPARCRRTGACRHRRRDRRRHLRLRLVWISP